MVIGQKTASKAYKKTEKFFTQGYEKVSDKFIKKFFTEEGESVEEAKKRLKANH